VRVGDHREGAGSASRGFRPVHLSAARGRAAASAGRCRGGRGCTTPTGRAASARRRAPAGRGPTAGGAGCGRARVERTVGVSQ